MLISVAGRPTPDEAQLLINHNSKAFARRHVPSPLSLPAFATISLISSNSSKGTVYLLTAEGAQPADTSVWKVWEAPTLTRRPAGWIDQIIQVDYPSYAESVLWTHGDAALFEPAPPGK